jgi:hypothetical protein
MAAEIHYAESAREARRADERLAGGDKPAPAPEPVRTTEDFVPARDRWKKKRRTVKRLPPCLPNDVLVDGIDWS